MPQPISIRIGTRGSKLALWQAQWVTNELKKRNTQLEIILVPIKTTGDQIDNVDLSKIGGKGLFIKEIEESLLNDKIDLAVHSVKDIPAELPRGLILATIPLREDPRDVLISHDNILFKQMPAGGRIGTSSWRRIYQLKKLRPDLDYIPLRGNVDTRLKKLERKEFDGIVLAVAGLIRLGFRGKITEFLPMVPAVGQGAMGVEIRASDKKMAKLISPLNDPESSFCVGVEREFLKILEATCTTPVGCHVTLEGEQARVDIFLCQPDGSRPFAMTHQLPRGEAASWIKKIAKEIRINDFS